MKFKIRLRKAATALFAALATGLSIAADYPASPVRLVVPFAAGGGTDNIARVVAVGLSKRLGQQVIVDNKGGAGGSVGTLAVVQSPADGYTLLLGSNGTMVLNPLLYSALRYKVDRDLVPVAGIASVPYLIAGNPQFAPRDVRTLLEAAKARPGVVTFASPGNGTTNHLSGVLLESMGKVDMNHIPYRGAAPAMNDVVAGQVDFMSGDFGTLLPMVKAGKLRPIAVTGAKRVPVLPDVPTVAEALPGFEATGWFGIFAPRDTPRAIVDRVSMEVAQVLGDPAVLQRLQEVGATPMPMSSDQLHRLVDAETGKWKKVIVDNKVTGDQLN